MIEDKTYKVYQRNLQVLRIRMGFVAKPIKRQIIPGADVSSSTTDSF